MTWRVPERVLLYSMMKFGDCTSISLKRWITTRRLFVIEAQQAFIVREAERESVAKLEGTVTKSNTFD